MGLFDFFRRNKKLNGPAPDPVGAKPSRIEPTQTIADPKAAALNAKTAGLSGDSSSEARRRATYALRLDKTPQGQARLVAALADSDEDVRGAAIVALGDFGLLKALELLNAFPEGSPGRASAAKLLLFSTLKDDIKSNIAEVYRSENLQAAIRKLLAISSEDDQTKAMGPAAALVTMTLQGLSSKVMGILIDDLALPEGKRLKTSLSIIKVMYRKTDVPAQNELVVWPLVEALGRDNDDLCTTVAALLCWMGKPAIEYLERGKGHANSKVRRLAQFTLDKIAEGAAART